MMSSQTIVWAALVVMCLQPAVQGQRRYYNNYYNYGRSLGDNVEEANCRSGTCGVNAQCTMSGIRPVCSCLPGHSGDPLYQCIRAECLDHSECRSFQACQNNNCINPCEGACGSNANCDVRNHLPVCSCPPHYTGNPFTGCRILDPEEACHPTPCGANTKCHVANNVPVCSCLPGFKGSAITGCRHECESDSECNYQQVCSNFKCNSPCNDCGVNAECDTVVNHRAVCKCPNGYIGDPYHNCQPECTGHSECPSYKPACYYNKCTDPCKGSCGTNADCNLRGLTPICSCPRNMTGDPFTYCRPFEARDLCEPNPCGLNSQCTPGHDRTGKERPVCTCLPGYVGNALVNCQRGECQIDAECPDHKACVGYACVDPCIGQCAHTAQCNARRHIAVCTCPGRTQGDALVSCREPIDVPAGRSLRYLRHY